MRPTFVVLSLSAAALVALPATASAAKVELTGSFSGKAEKPGPGDSDGKGKAKVTVDTKTGRVCWEFTGVKGIATPSAAHIHKAKKGAAGPIFVDFKGYKAKGCVTSTKSSAKAIAKTPADYYANIHNADFPGGAIRAQLKKAD